MPTSTSASALKGPREAETPTLSSVAGRDAKRVKCSEVDNDEQSSLSSAETATQISEGRRGAKCVKYSGSDIDEQTSLNSAEAGVDGEMDAWDLEELSFAMQRWRAEEVSAAREENSEPATLFTQDSGAEQDEEEDSFPTSQDGDLSHVGAWAATKT